MAALVASQVCALAVWFSSAAILPDLDRMLDLSPTWRAAFTAAVQLGFVVGALASAVTGLADRGDPRRLFAAAATLAALANAGLLVVPPGSAAALVLRLVVGFALAGVYPVGMKIAIGWGKRDRGFLVSLLVGALTLGTAAPHLIAALGGADWRATIAITSLSALIGAGLVAFARPGPYHASSGRFRFAVAKLAWTDRRIRLANIGYLGHMWELYAFWAWAGVMLSASFAARIEPQAAVIAGKYAAFAVIAIGVVGCLAGGWAADRIGKIEVTIIAMIASGSAALAVAAGFGGPVWLVTALALIWGLAVIADSAQFSATVADFALPDEVGTMLSVQTGLGFLLTVLTVHTAPIAADFWGWPATLAALALGPAAGSAAMLRLRVRVRGPARHRRH